MIVKNLVVGAFLAAGLAAAPNAARACGNGPMAMGVGMGMVAPVGAVAMAAPAVAATVAFPTIGTTVSVLPEGYLTVVVNGASFFRFGPTWYQPFQGPAGHMYRVVPAPHGM